MSTLAWGHDGICTRLVTTYPDCCIGYSFINKYPAGYHRISPTLFPDFVVYPAPPPVILPQASILPPTLSSVPTILASRREKQ